MALLLSGYARVVLRYASRGLPTAEILLNFRKDARIAKAGLLCAVYGRKLEFEAG